MKHIRIAILTLFITVSAPLWYAHAATISFDPQETTVGMSSPFLVGVTIDADTPINAIRAVIDIPESMQVLDASDGNSVVNLWVERPQVTGHQLILSGIIPGGFTGLRGKLITLTVQATKEGKHTFIIDPSSRVYESDPDATPEPIYTKPLELMVSASKDNIANPLPDSTPPEPFTPKLTQIVSDNGSTAWAVSFGTQDKQSGVASYEVAESSRTINLSNTAGLEGLPWQEAESPYVLADQGLSSNIYVKAIDEKGNERFAYLPALHPQPWYVRAEGYILILILALFALYLFKRFVRITRR